MTGRTPDADGVEGAGRLMRRYRQLLLAYPRSYRRDRGPELLGALLDAAAPGRTRPTVREAVDLLRGGMRARLGRPASRSVVGWAVVVAMIGGFFGAAAATRIGWEAAAPLPSRAEAFATVAEILPGQGFTGFEEPPATFISYGNPLDGGGYGLAAMRGGIAGAPTRPVPELAELARRNLQAHGWTVYPVAEAPGFIVVTAKRGGLTIWLGMYPDMTAAPAVSVAFEPATPVAVYPAGIVGGLVAAFMAFLVFGWASRRTQGRGSDGIERVMLGFTMLLWWVPTLLGVRHMVRHHTSEPHPSWHPMWEWLGQPMFSGMFLFGCASAAVALVVCAVAEDRRPAEVRGVR